MSRHFGIDFGTTTTAFVCFDDERGKYENIEDPETGGPFHSIIVLDPLNGRVFDKGYSAWENRIKYDLEDQLIVIGSVKKELSSKKVWKAGNTLWTPVMVSSEVLRMGVEQIQRLWSDIELPITAVMAVPVDFGYEERSQIIKAAYNAGIVVSQFVSEPTAAIVGMDVNIDNVRHVMVFDWGGGTLDVSVLRLSFGRIVELFKDGDRIGGDTLDELFARWLHNEDRKTHHSTYLFDDVPARTRDRLLARSEIEKVHLSSTTEVEVNLTEYLGHRLAELADRTMFENIIFEKVEEVISLALRTLKSAKLTLDELDMVLLVGGSSKIPLVKRNMNRIFGARCEYPTEAEWSIAKGAARLAAYPGNYLLSKSIGVVLSDNSFLPVLRRGERIDHEAWPITLGLVEDAKDARLVIAESNHDTLFNGEHDLIDVISIPAGGFHLEPIEVEFKIEKDLSLSVSAGNGLNRAGQRVDRKYTRLEFEYLLEKNNDK